MTLSHAVLPNIPFAEPIAAASLLLVIWMVPAVPALSLIRLVEHERRASEGRTSGL